MGTFVCEEFNVKRKMARIAIKGFFYVLGILPYVVIFALMTLYVNSVENQATMFTFTKQQFLNTMATIGACTCWFLFCKVFKLIFTLLNTGSL